MKTITFIKTSILITFTIILNSCGDNATTTAGVTVASSALTGVAATGAPISNGQVEIKGKNGLIVETTTSSSGVYQAAVSNLTSPFLIRVTAPTGERFISVASEEDLANNKKVNITPLTHTIVANVFENKDPGSLFDNFMAEASEFTNAKLESQKDELLDSLINSGVIGGSGILNDTSLDLMNGDFVAGSGQGMDKVLDALDVDVESSTKIEIKIKGAGTTIISDDPTVLDETPVDVSGDIAAASAQLTVLDEIKGALLNMTQSFSAIESCNGAAVTSGACDKNSLHATIAGFFHTDYKWNGRNGSTDAWGFFCQDTQGEEATDATSCTQVDAAGVSMTDVTVLSYDAGNSLATVSFNFYYNGEFDGQEVEIMKKDGADWKFYGNQHLYRVWINAQSMHETENNLTNNTTQEKYRSELDLYLDSSDYAAASTNITNITLKAVDNNDLYTAMGGAPIALELFNNNLIVSSRKYRDFSTNVEQATTCANCDVNWDANRIALTDAIMAKMKSKQKFELSFQENGVDLNGNAVTNDIIVETFYVNKPLPVSSANAASVMPILGDSNLCSIARTSFSVSAPAGMELDWLSVYYSEDSTWTSHNGGSNISSNANSVDLSASLSSITGSEVLGNANYWLSAQDSYGRRFVRIINCHP